MIKQPPRIGFPHNLGIEERASLVCYGELVINDPSAATYDAVSIARQKSYSTVKNQLDSARRKMGTNTTWGAYLMMISKEKAQTEREWKRNTSAKPGQPISRPARTGKSGTPQASVPVPAAS